MDDPSSSTLLLAVLLLLASSAALAAAEFSLIALRRSRPERPGEAAAARVLASSPQRLEALVLAAQVARSFASVLLGWMAALLGARLTAPLGATAMAGALCGVAAAALLHAVLGHQVPRLLGVRGAGSRALDPSPEALRAMVEQAGERSEMEEDEREMIRGVFDFRETVAREVMTPRTDVVAVPATVAWDELLRVVTEEGHSRIPVYEDSIDNVVGVLLVKDLLPMLASRAGSADAPFDVRSLMREPLFVPDTKPVNALLAELRSHGVHLAVVVDEFGGTYGVVTMEDLLEEIVGEIRDEYDEASEAEPEFEPTPEGDVLIDGAAAIGEVNERFGLALPEEDFDTVGGYVFGALGRLPVVGDAVRVEGPEGPLELRVEETEERRVSLLRLAPPAPAAPEPAERSPDAALVVPVGKIPPAGVVAA